MDCSKKSSPNHMGPPRPLEYLCRGCNIVKCRECGIAEHTEPQCSLVRLSALGKVDIDQWCEELKEKFNRAISIGAQMEGRHKSLLIEQRKIQDRSREICQSVGYQFATVFDAVRQSHDKLIAEVKEVERIATEKLQKRSAPVEGILQNVLLETRNASQQLFDLSTNTTVVTKEILVEFLSKKSQVDSQLKSIFSELVKDENPAENILDEFLSTATGQITRLINSISSFGRSEEAVRPASIPFSLHRQSATPNNSNEIHSSRSSDVQLIEDEESVEQAVGSVQHCADTKLESAVLSQTVKPSGIRSYYAAQTVPSEADKKVARGNASGKAPRIPVAPRIAVLRKKKTAKTARKSTGAKAPRIGVSGACGYNNVAQPELKRRVMTIGRTYKESFAPRLSLSERLNKKYEYSDSDQTSESENEESQPKKVKLLVEDHSHGRESATNGGSVSSASSGNPLAKPPTKMRLEQGGDWWAKCITCAVCREDNPNEKGVACDRCDFVFHPSCHLPPFSPKDTPKGDWFCGKCVEVRRNHPSVLGFTKQMCQRILLRQCSFSKNPRQFIDGGKGKKSDLNDFNRIRQHLLDCEAISIRQFAMIMKLMYEWHAKNFNLDYVVPYGIRSTLRQKILDYHRHFKMCFEEYFPGMWSSQYDLMPLA